MKLTYTGLLPKYAATVLQLNESQLISFLMIGVVFNATFINISVISWRSFLLVEETGVPEENHRPVASH
jgi:hypothetical protein